MAQAAMNRVSCLSGRKLAPMKTMQSIIVRHCRLRYIAPREVWLQYQICCISVRRRVVALLSTPGYVTSTVEIAIGIGNTSSLLGLSNSGYCCNLVGGWMVWQ